MWLTATDSLKFNFHVPFGRTFFFFFFFFCCSTFWNLINLILIDFVTKKQESAIMCKTKKKMRFVLDFVGNISATRQNRGPVLSNL